MWAQVGYALLMMVISYGIALITAPKIRPPKPAAFEEFDFPQFEEGMTQSVVFGDVWIKDWIILGVGHYDATPIKSKGGKK